MDTLGGNVVRLEPLEPRHTSGLFSAVGNDDEAWRWMIVKTPQTHSDLEKIVEIYFSEQKVGLRQPFAVIEKSTDRVIGTTSFMDISKKDRSLEIGSTIYGREFWRSAVNTETKYLLLTRAFEEMNCIRVSFKTDSLNLRSQSAISRLGATFEGTFRSHRIRADGTIRNSMYYSIIDSEWPQVKSRLEAMLA